MKTKPIRTALKDLLREGHSSDEILDYVSERLNKPRAPRAKASTLDRLRKAGEKRNNLPDDEYSLHKLIKQHHPDTGTAVDTDTFCLAVNKLKQMRKAQ